MQNILIGEIDWRRKTTINISLDSVFFASIAVDQNERRKIQVEQFFLLRQDREEFSRGAAKSAEFISESSDLSSLRRWLVCENKKLICLNTFKSLAPPVLTKEKKSSLVTNYFEQLPVEHFRGIPRIQVYWLSWLFSLLSIELRRVSDIDENLR